MGQRSARALALTPEDHRALEVYWGFFEPRRAAIANDVPGPVQGKPEWAPEDEGSLARQADACLNGRWEPYLDDLRARGDAYARSGVTFTTWIERVGVFRHVVRRHLAAFVREGGEDAASLAPAIGRGLDRMVDIGLAVVGEAYVAAKEDLVAQHARRFASLFEKSPLPMWTFDRNTLAFVTVNEAAVRHYGYTRAEFARMTLADIRPPEDLAALHEDVEQARGLVAPRSWRHRKKDGTLIHVRIVANDFDIDGRPLRLVLAQDVTEQERAEQALARAEEQLRHSQKMEAVGKLAGGVAHDFNNLLSVILSCSDFLLQDIPPGDARRADVEEIRTSGMRAAALTRQLLLFSRQQVVAPTRVDLNALVTTMDRMLQRLIGDDVALVSRLAPEVGAVVADAGHMEQVILNLVVNARDAMPRGGRITMETADVVLDEAYARDHLGVVAGPYVMIAVSDTGVGMNKDTQARIFEPFFTTKGQGKGTGLGLSTVFGIVQQSGGTIWVYSEPGKGSTFKVYLPRADLTAQTARGEVERPETTGSETILLVEDDPQVRAVAEAILVRQGYTVLVAHDATEARTYAERHAGPIDLLLSDVVMPEISGPDLADFLSSKRPTMKVLFMSGYTDDSVGRHGLLDATVAFLQKPITPETLTRKVRETLDPR